MSESSPFDSLIAAASELVGELSSALPRLLERSKDQLAIVVALADKLPCIDLGVGSSDESSASEPSATPSPVAAITSAPSAVAAAKQVAAKAPAKKAPAKKAPARKAPAKVVAKKAPAKKAAAKTVAKKAPAKKAPAKKAAAAPAVAANPLGLSSYDSLAASQVIPRLDALSPAELEAVREHETAGRNRRTILNRVAQLQRG